MKKIKNMKAAIKFAAFCAAIAAIEGLIIRSLNIVIAAIAAIKSFIMKVIGIIKGEKRP